MHNTQPWRFKVGEHGIEVFLDRSRALPAEDPTGRALLIAAGASVFNLSCAAASLGFDSHYDLLPEVDEGGLVARIMLRTTAAPDRALVDLSAQISRRHTSREPGLPASMLPEAQLRLTHAASHEGALTSPGWIPTALRTF